MVRSTKVFKTGLQILTGMDVPVYSLEYMDATKNHKIGEFEKIVVPYIEIGRDKSCVIHFDDDTPTVSRKHAAIVRHENQYLLKHLSKTNETFVNNTSIEEEAILKNGDEIRFSATGPRIRFNTSGTGTAKIGFTKKMNLVIQQAIRPYKTTLAVILAFFLVSMAALGYALKDTKTALITTQSDLDSFRSISLNQAAELVRLNEEKGELEKKIEINNLEFQEKIEKFRKEIQKQKAKDLADLSSKMDSAIAISPNISTGFAEQMAKNQKHIFAIFLVDGYVEFNGRKIGLNEFDEHVDLELPSLVCSGFLLEGGEFVTARHCIDLFMDGDAALNFFANSGGNLVLKFQAKSQNEDIQFEFTNMDMDFNNANDKRVQIYHPTGIEGVIREPDFFNGSDWAIMSTNLESGLSYDKTNSAHLKAFTDLYVMGYPDGMKFRGSRDLRPDVNKGMVRRDGLEKGLILGVQGAERGGNSGGPVMYLKNGQIKVVGIVCGNRTDLSSGHNINQFYTPLSGITKLN